MDAHYVIINYRKWKNDFQVISEFACLLGHPVSSLLVGWMQDWKSDIHLLVGCKIENAGLNSIKYQLYYYYMISLSDNQKISFPSIFSLRNVAYEYCNCYDWHVFHSTVFRLTLYGCTKFLFYFIKSCNKYNWLKSIFNLYTRSWWNFIKELIFNNFFQILFFKWTHHSFLLGIDLWSGSSSYTLYIHRSPK